MIDAPMKLMLVDDEDDFRRSCARWMLRKGHDVSDVSNSVEALGRLEQSLLDVVVLDINMPGMSGLELLQRIQDEKIDVEVIMLTGQGTIDIAVSAMKMGACDFITKPCSLSDLEHRCLLAYERRCLRRENNQLKAVISRVQPDVQLVGESKAIRDVVRMIERIAPTDKPVLIQGESGSGKEVVARMIQQSSPLRDKPFVTINCAALPASLVESELFGHQKGAFTGATIEKPGLFEIADGGTLFIDEIGELPLSLQPKLLRVLEDGSMRRVGSHKERNVRVRLIAATNRDLTNEVQSGNFREDLFYRVNVLSLNLPPLREREGDVDLLISHFLPTNWRMEPQVREAMNQYAWPGNVRQLINVIQRATVLADHNEITLEDLPSEIATCRGDSFTTETSQVEEPHDDFAVIDKTHAILGASDCKLDDIAREHILGVLAKEHGNKARAARKLGIHRRKLYRLLERFTAVEEPVQ